MIVNYDLNSSLICKQYVYIANNIVYNAKWFTM